MSPVEFHMPFSFGKDPKGNVQERVTYQATPEGRRQVEEYLIEGIPAQVLSAIVEREGSCTMSYIKNRTGLPEKTIVDNINSFKGLRWITHSGGGYSGGMGMPSYQPPMRR
jgi:hypothetical protein